MKKSHGYPIKIKYFSGYFNGRKYAYEWPDELSDDSKMIIKTTMYRSNRVLLNCVDDNVEDLFSGNVYFYIFKEGAALFKLMENSCATCVANELEGVFIPKKYVDTAWFYIKELVIFINGEEFYDYQKDEEVYEDTLLDIYRKNTHSSVTFNRRVSEVPYSFAISVSNPRIGGVAHIPVNNRSNREIEGCERLTDDPARILNIKRIFDCNENTDMLQNLIIKRNKKAKNKGGKSEKISSTWVGENTDKGIEIELKYLDGEEAVKVDGLIRDLFTMV